MLQALHSKFHSSGQSLIFNGQLKFLELYLIISLHAGCHLDHMPFYLWYAQVLVSAPTQWSGNLVGFGCPHVLEIPFWIFRFAAWSFWFGTCYSSFNYIATARLIPSVLWENVFARDVANSGCISSLPIALWYSSELSWDQQRCLGTLRSVLGYESWPVLVDFVIFRYAVTVDCGQTGAQRFDCKQTESGRVQAS